MKVRNDSPLRNSKLLRFSNPKKLSLLYARSWFISSSQKKEVKDILGIIFPFWRGRNPHHQQSNVLPLISFLRSSDCSMWILVFMMILTTNKSSCFPSLLDSLKILSFAMVLCPLLSFQQWGIQGPIRGWCHVNKWIKYYMEIVKRRPTLQIFLRSFPSQDFTFFLLAFFDSTFSINL